MSRHLGRSLSDEGVHIIDPFVCTGIFPVRLLQSGLIKPEDLNRKFTTELHANEIVLLAYYIAAVNVEAAYAELAGDIGEYQPFEDIVLVDTFQLAEGGAAMLDGMEVLEGNSERARRQKSQPIMVVIGNPPYSKGQEARMMIIRTSSTRRLTPASRPRIQPCPRQKTRTGYMTHIFGQSAGRLTASRARVS